MFASHPTATLKPFYKYIKDKTHSRLERNDKRRLGNYISVFASSFFPIGQGLENNNNAQKTKNG